MSNERSFRLALDIGFGFVKAAVVLHGNNNTDGNGNDCSYISFPSVVSKRFDNSLKGYIGGSSDDYSIVYWESDENGKNVNEKKCYVGDAGITNGGTRKWEDKQFNLDEMKILISTAIAVLLKDEHLNSNDKINICVGLPMSYYLQKKDELVESLKSLNSHVNLYGITGTFDIHFNSIYCFPQGAGAYFASFMDCNGKVINREVAGSSVGVIDIGYRTVDYLVMGKGRKGITLIDGLSGSLEEDGMNKVFQSIQKNVSELPDIQHEIPLAEIEKSILWFGSKYEFRGKEYNISDIEEKAYKEQAEKISSKIKIKWGTEGESLSYIFITGGGGEALYDILKTKFDQATLQDKCLYSNCFGFLGAQARKMQINK